MQIPKNHQAVMPYLMVSNASHFTDFAKEVFDAEHTFSRMREDNKTVMHSELQIAGNTIMYCDSTEQWPAATANLFVYVEDADAAFNKALKAGSSVVTPLKDESYGRAGGIRDPFGNVWWITSVNE